MMVKKIINIRGNESFTYLYDVAGIIKQLVYKDADGCGVQICNRFVLVKEKKWRFGKFQYF